MNETDSAVEEWHRQHREAEDDYFIKVRRAMNEGSEAAWREAHEAFGPLVRKVYGEGLVLPPGVRLSHADAYPLAKGSCCNERPSPQARCREGDLREEVQDDARSRTLTRADPDLG